MKSRRKYMISEKVDLYEYFGLKRPQNGCGYLVTYVHGPMELRPNRLRPAMLVIGGGGYSYVSQREKEPIAFKFLAESYNTFVLEYSCAPVAYPAQLNEGLMAMVYIRENAAKLGIIADRVAAIGFSAGGHLCAMLANLFDSKDAKKLLGDKISLARPDAVILSYPVISSGEKAHRGSFDNICAGNAELEKSLSLENRVKENSSPAFIWATANDGCVPSENSLYYALACKKHNVPFELHVFAEGQHGLSIADEEVFTVNEPVQIWVKLALVWLKNRGFCIEEGEY